ncbi:lytic transglycosylase domain-containing protein [Xanthovirga aplysinae]|uniref:lytic transglycosylase domain-containing protein n=1 Tax=Xanthovirga aplysinae TaxID=2529853 RepID=UPI0012BC8FBD|nr:lytic transglycosylase domain-containing protein [Xanthovirga aplysinae]MTI29913.1 lytic transglycosylase domain-containing protein [Xanthovirga aplysinae]
MKNQPLIYLLLFVILFLGGFIFYQNSNFLKKRQSQEPYFSSSFEEPLSPEYRQPFQVYTFDTPDSLSFAGEAVPLHEEDVRERLDREVHVNAYWHSSTIFLIKRANRWLPQIEPILKKYGIPQDFKYLTVIESGLQNVVSPKGATGFWQLMKGTAKDLGLEVNKEVDERYNALKSTEAACKYLLQAYEKFGNWTAVAASYNMGMRGFSRSVKQQKVTSYYDLLLNHETARYVFRILAIKAILENPKKYGYDLPDNQLYKQPPLKEIKVNKSISKLVDFSLEQGITYKDLKLYNPWLRAKKLTVSKRSKGYTLLIPEKRRGFSD